MTREEIVKYIEEGAYECTPTSDSARELMEDLIEVYHLDRKDPDVQQAYTYAFVNGHLYGYYEVLCHFEDLIQALKTGSSDT